MVDNFHMHQWKYNKYIAEIVIYLKEENGILDGFKKGFN